MGLKFGKSKGGPTAKALKALVPHDENTTTIIQPWHHGEPKSSWWLEKDRAAFQSQAQAERTRIVNSAMARRLGTP
jgi:hypothetical protein